MPLTNTFDDVRFKLPAALNNKLLVDIISPEPAPADIKLFATMLPDTNTLGVVKLIAPTAVIFKLPVDVKVADVAVGDTKLLAITLPAVRLPVYVDRNELTLALLNDEDAVGAAQNKLPVPFVCNTYPVKPSVCGHDCPSSKILPVPLATNSMLEFPVVDIDRTPTLSIIPPVKIKLPTPILPVYVGNAATIFDNTLAFV